MRRIAVVLALVFGVGLLGGTALASDIPDGADCTDVEDSGVFMGTEGEDRGAACVAAAGTTILYVGGEATEETDNDGDGTVGEPCGAVIVADQTLAGNPDWDQTDGDPTNDPDPHCD